MARTILSISLVFILLLAGSAAGLSALAQGSVFQPDSALFFAQELAETVRAAWTSNPGDRLDYALTVLERRTQDLAVLADQPAERSALYAVDRALNRALESLAALSPQQRLVNDRPVLDHLASLTVILDLMRQVEQDPPSEMESLAAKTAALRNLVITGPPATESLAELSRWVLSSPAPRGNYTLEMLRQGDGGGFTHAAFPLSAPHTTLNCLQCHAAPAGDAASQPNTSAVCQSCHAGKKPAVHFEGSCASCHFTSAWIPAIMNHAQGVSDCQSCHQARRPANHFPGQCSQCHSAPTFSGGVRSSLAGGALSGGSAWRIIKFNHAVAGVTDCQSCHASRKPADHFSGQCSQCHTAPGGGTITGWKPASFTHPAATADCAGCHANRKPANHYAGQCSQCHLPPSGAIAIGWKAGQFNHTAAAADCQSCHASRKPANHYTGQCSACHAAPVTGTASTGWKGAKFNHAAVVVTNCAGCHADRKPASHYTGQCSLCHAVPVTGTASTGWKGARMNHAAVGAADCQSCHANRKPANHYTGQCSSCHATSAWRPATFNHTAAGATDCQSCHANRRPANHYAGQCSSCHATSAWRPATFNHAADAATNCSGCHANRRPANHYAGQCSSCHSTSAWRPANFNHTAAGATDCQSCHASRRPANHFSGQCSQCHTTSAWKPATFKHTFPMTHGGASSQCSKCHPSSPPAYTCFGCHNQTELAKKHAEKSLPFTNCMQCHANGKAP